MRSISILYPNTLVNTFEQGSRARMRILWEGAMKVTARNGDRKRKVPGNRVPACAWTNQCTTEKWSMKLGALGGESESLS